jgi:DNA-binding NtrC family response regulator
MSPWKQAFAAPPSPALLAAHPVSRRVLIVEDEQGIRDILTELFDVAGSRVDGAGTLDEAKQALGAQVYDLIVTDIRLGGKRDGGLQVMAASGLLSPDAAVIVLTAYPDADNRHASLRLGATHFLEKPVDLQTIAALAAQAGVPSALIPVAAEQRSYESNGTRTAPTRS